MSVPSASVISPKGAGSVLCSDACCASALDLPRLHPVKPCLSLVKDGGIDDRADGETSKLLNLAELDSSDPSKGYSFSVICILKRMHEWQPNTVALSDTEV